MCKLRVVITVFLLMTISASFANTSLDGHFNSTDNLTDSTYSSDSTDLVVLTSTVEQAWISAIGSDRIDRLIQLGQTHALSSLLELTAINGKSALMVAAKKGDVGFATTLVDHGANVHDTTVTNGTAFMFAILGNQREMVEWLHEAGSDINVVGSNGWTADHCSSKR